MKKILSLLTVAVLLLAGCSAGSEESSGPVTLTYAIPDSGPNVEFQQQIVDDYNASQDEVEIVLQAYGTAFDQKFSAAAGTESAPDIVKVWNYSAYSPLLLPLNDYVKSLDNYDDFYPALWQYTSVGDDVFGVPVGWSTRALYADQAKIDESGVTVDPNDWSLADFKAIVEGLPAEQGLYAYYDYQAYSVEAYAWIFGSEGWIDNQGNANLTDPAIIEMLEAYHDLVYTSDGVKLNSTDSGLLDQDFATGEYAFADYGYWLAPTIAEANPNFTVYPFPGKEGGIGPSVIHASGLSVTADTEYPEQAMDFINYYTSYDNITRLTKFEMPVLQSVADDMKLGEDPLYAPYVEELNAADGYQSSMLKTNNWGEAEVIISEMIQKIIMDENADVAAICEEYNTKLEAVLE